MTVNYDFISPAHLIAQPITEQQRLIELAARTLSPAFLLQYERMLFDYIDEQYPDNPGSLLNLDYRYGNHLKREFKRLFDQGLQRQAHQVLEFTLAAQRIAFRAQLEGMEAAFHDQQRPLRQQQRADQIEYEIQMTRAMDGVLQADLARQAQFHQHQRELETWQHDHALALRQFEAGVDATRQALDRPQALQLRLLDIWTDLNRYRMALDDRANRNPALADRLRATAMGLAAVMANVQTIITQLNAAGPYQPTDEQLREQTMSVLNMAMEQMHQWFNATTSETIN